MLNTGVGAFMFDKEAAEHHIFVDFNESTRIKH